jgi:hypothetical protein
MVLSHVPQSDYRVGSDCPLPRLAPLLARSLPSPSLSPSTALPCPQQAPRPVGKPLGSVQPQSLARQRSLQSCWSSHSEDAGAGVGVGRSVLAHDFARDDNDAVPVPVPVVVPPQPPPAAAVAAPRRTRLWPCSSQAGVPAVGTGFSIPPLGGTGVCAADCARVV